jgi:hypothetical protein
MADVNAFLAELFRAHAVEAVPHGEWIAFPRHGLRANGAVVLEQSKPPWETVQLDFRFEVAPGRLLVESFGGFGQTKDQAVADAQQFFAQNTFHVLLAAFFARPCDDQASREEWVVGGRNRRVTHGHIGVRGKLPAGGPESVEWFQRFEEKLKAKSLPEGTHWVRLYYAQVQRKAAACEVLLDNAVWGELQAEMAAISWPPGEEFYSMRVFLVLREAPGGMTDLGVSMREAVPVFVAHAASDVGTLLAALEEAGIAKSIAADLVEFLPLALARSVLEGTGVRFARRREWPFPTPGGRSPV